MREEKYQKLARAVKKGLPLSEAKKLLKDEPSSLAKEAFWRELGNEYTNMAILTSTKFQLLEYKKDKTWEELFDLILELLEENACKDPV